MAFDAINATMWPQGSYSLNVGTITNVCVEYRGGETGLLLIIAYTVYRQRQLTLLFCTLIYDEASVLVLQPCSEGRYK